MRPARSLLALVSTALGPFVALLVVIAFFSVADWLNGGNTFFTVQNFRTVAKEACIFAVAALGMTLIVISGGIDLSAGSALALAATVLAWGIQNDVALLATKGSSFRSASTTSRVWDALCKVNTTLPHEDRPRLELSPKTQGSLKERFRLDDDELKEAESAGARILKSGMATDWGGYIGYFADPDGHAWEIAWNPAFPIAPDGSISLPR